MKSVLLIRADANAEIGGGHVMRTFALAQAWQREGGEAVFAAATMPVALLDRLNSAGLRLEKIESPIGSSGDLDRTVAIAGEICANCVVADGYSFGDAWQRGMKVAGWPLLVIDDYGHASHYYADAVLNQNLGVNESLYCRREPATRLLLGNRFVLLREEFHAFRDRIVDIPAKARRILVTFGASDPENLTALTLQALASLPASDLEVRVVVGSSYAPLSALKAIAAAALFPYEIVVAATNMPELMAQADLAISAAGSTAWELAFMQIPMILIVAAANQCEIGRQLAAAEAAVNLGERGPFMAQAIATSVHSLLADQKHRGRLAGNARWICDGRGTERAVAALHALCR